MFIDDVLRITNHLRSFVNNNRIEIRVQLVICEWFSKFVCLLLLYQQLKLYMGQHLHSYLYLIICQPLLTPKLPSSSSKLMLNVLLHAYTPITRWNRQFELCKHNLLGNKYEFLTNLIRCLASFISKTLSTLQVIDFLRQWYSWLHSNIYSCSSWRDSVSLGTDNYWHGLNIVAFKVQLNTPPFS
jgi:hypothetical protein